MKYTEAEIEVVYFGTSDVVTTDPDSDEQEPTA